jgi:DNA-binding CsgD family transcriptional regulator
VGVVLTGPTAEVMHMNRAARTIVSASDGLVLNRNRMGASRASEGRTLVELVRRASSEDLGHDAGTRVVQITRSNGRPLMCLVAGLRQPQAEEGRAAPDVAVFVTDPDAFHSPAYEVLRELYDLTPAEARLARLLARGRSLREAARLHTVALSTVRTQVKGVLQKTGTRRQAELVALMAHSSIAWCQPGPAPEAKSTRASAP